MSLNILLIGDEIIKSRTSIHGNIDPKLIYPNIKIAQDMYILPLIGTALYNKLQTDINNNALTGDYQTLVNSFIIDALIYYTLSELPVNISYQFWNKGIVRKQGEDTELPSMEELVNVGLQFRKYAEFYANRLRLYLKQNASTKFPEYINYGSGIDDIKPEHKAYTMPLWLGDDDNCISDNDPRRFEKKYQGNNPNCCD